MSRNIAGLVVWVLLLISISIGPCAAAGFPIAGVIPTAASTEQKANLESLELVWSTLRDRYWDSTMAGLDWQAIHRQYEPQMLAAHSANEARQVLIRMIGRLPSSHLAIIPRDLYTHKPNAEGDKDQTAAASSNIAEDDDSGLAGITVEVIGRQIVVESVEPNSAAAKSQVRPGWSIDAVDGQSVRALFALIPKAEPGGSALLISDIVESWLKGPVNSTVSILFATPEGKTWSCRIARERPPGEAVQFGNLPTQYVHMDHRKLRNGVGYIRLNVFLDPVRVMPELAQALAEFSDSPGIVLDLRNNPGGLGIMAMGFAGWFVDKQDLRLGTMTSRDSTFNFVINPRLNPYRGRLAILMNGGSASTAEILAQGLHDLGRARIFGTRSAGAALPSDIIELPNGDRFQYPEANYVSRNGRVLERNGVQPDVIVAPAIAALLEGRDLPLEAASAWSKQP